MIRGPGFDYKKTKSTQFAHHSSNKTDSFSMGGLAESTSDLLPKLARNFSPRDVDLPCNFYMAPPSVWKR